MKQARQSHSSCYLGGFIYVCCGEGDNGLLNSVERLKILESNPSNQPSQSWQLLSLQNFPSNFQPRQWLLVSAINEQDILIMGGHDGSWRNDGFILSTDTCKCEKVAQGGPFAFLTYSNASTQYTENKVVALVLDNSSKPQLIEYQVGMSTFSVIKELPKYWQQESPRK